jgi:hypothetical protein
MVKIRILNSRPTHDLFFAKELMTTILAYFQYDDVKKVYKDWRCTKPKKPILSLRKCNNTEGAREKFISSSHDIIYVIYERGSKFDAGLFLLLANTNKIVKWQCPTCKEYSTIQHEPNVEKSSETVIILKNVDIFNEESIKTECIICDCFLKGTDCIICEKRTNIIDLQKALDYHYDRRLVEARLKEAKATLKLKYTPEPESEYEYEYVSNWIPNKYSVDGGYDPNEHDTWDQTHG